MVREVPDITAPHFHCASASAEEGAISEWEAVTHTKLPAKLRKIAIEAYRIHHKENRGITREDIIDLEYTEGYAKKILFECQKNKLLVPLEGYKQGRYKEYFLSTEIGRFIEKKQSADSSQQQQQSPDPTQISVIQLLVNEIA